MATSAVSPVAQQLGTLLVEEAKLLNGVEDEVEELRRELLWMQGFLQDIDKRQHREELLRIWVSEVRNIAYEAEDIVQNFVHGVSHQHQADGLWGAVTRYSCILRSAWKLHKVGSAIVKLTRRITKLNERLKSYGVSTTRLDEFHTHHITKIRNLRQTYSEAGDQDFVMGENNIRDMADQVASLEHKVVGLVGMGGLGKSTLARKIYQDHAIKDRFEAFAWVYISQQPQQKPVLWNTLRGLQPQIGDASKFTEEELKEKIRVVMVQKRCLVVIDDIWYEETWHLLKHAFSTIKESQSKLLLTTRHKDVVKEADPDALVLDPKFLNDEDSWELLRLKASHGNEFKIDCQMEVVGRKIAKHCEGLPIAIVSLGGILAARSTVDEWKEVEKHTVNHLSKARRLQEGNMGAMQVLELSYNDLPYYLKPCFLCMGNFPEDYEIPTARLYQIWQAEDLIRASEDDEFESDGTCIYDIGEQYLNELVQRCMVQVGELYPNSRIKTCRLHDLMRDLCLKKSKEEKFLEAVTIDDVDKMSSEKIWRSRRATVNLGDGSADSFFSERQRKAELQLRSLVMFWKGSNDSNFKNWFSKMRKALTMVRVLYLENGCVMKMPQEAGSCIHLRYLRVGLGRLKQVPSFVWNLAYLQTLDLGRMGTVLWGKTWIPNKLRKLIRLVNLYLPEDYATPQKLRLGQPSKMKTLVNIDPGDLHVDDLRKLTNLRILSFNRFSPPLVGAEGLKLLLNTVITSKLLQIPVIRHLKIDAERVNGDLRILASNSPVIIDALTIMGVIKHGLSQIVFPRTIRKLRLCDGEIDGDHIADLKMPELEYLCIIRGTMTGRKIVLSAESFPNLEGLVVLDVGSSEGFEVEGGALSNLELFNFEGTKLIKTPDGLPPYCKINRGRRPVRRRPVGAEAAGADYGRRWVGSGEEGGGGEDCWVGEGVDDEGFGGGVAEEDGDGAGVEAGVEDGAGHGDGEVELEHGGDDGEEGGDDVVFAEGRGEC